MTGKSIKPKPPLTKRQTDALRCIAYGNTIDETAKILGISRNSVMELSKRIRQNLSARNITHAVTIALRNGFL